MVWLIAGAAFAALFYASMRWLATTSPSKVKRLAITLGIVFLVMIAFVLVLSGRGAVSWPFLLAAAGLYFRLRRAFGLWSSLGRWSSRRQPSGGQRSTVASAYLRMTLDHDSGTLGGEVVAGLFAGRQLAELTHEELLAKLKELRQADSESARLLESYLDRRWPGWRAAYAGPGDSAQPPSQGAMTRDEARDILGLGANPSPQEVRAAHRRLMQKLHPDHGGSTYLAAKINQAKDVLLQQ
ncbi:MAG: molecular chaperone DnaJ [Pseudomonadota bacterium]